MAKFFTDYSKDELTRKLSSLIEVENKDSLKTHLLHTILFKDEGKVSGIINNDRFQIWTHEQGRWTGATGVFYPIVEGRVRQLGRGLEIELKSKMNVVGRTIFFIIILGIGFGITTGIIIQEDNSLKFLIPRFLISALIFGLFISLPTFILNNTTNIIKGVLIKELKLKTYK